MTGIWSAAELLKLLIKVTVWKSVVIAFQQESYQVRVKENGMVAEEDTTHCTHQPQYSFPAVRFSNVRFPRCVFPTFVSTCAMLLPTLEEIYLHASSQMHISGSG